MKKWSKEAEDIDMGWDRLMVSHMELGSNKYSHILPLWLNHMKRGMEL